MKRLAVMTHRRIDETAGAIQLLLARSAQVGAELVFDAEETEKHRIGPRDGVETGAGPEPAAVDVCLALGGDGTILRALQRYAHTGVPVFAFNFGEIGFLATVERDEVGDGIDRALAGDFELLQLPAIVLDLPSGMLPALNDVAIHRKVGERVAEMAYAVDGEEAGSVRCDGLVVATPAGSTGYNLANGGPVMAWGVAGYVVSFVAPHSLSARPLVVSPGDGLTIINRSHEPLDLGVDGRPAGEIAAGASIRVRFEHDVSTLAQLPGTSFYGRLREKFGRLAS
jgi:NAD+ kinase